jgi:hypothetical protein
VGSAIVDERVTTNGEKMIECSDDM